MSQNPNQTDPHVLQLVTTVLEEAKEAIVLTNRLDEGREKAIRAIIDILHGKDGGDGLLTKVSKLTDAVSELRDARKNSTKTKSDRNWDVVKIIIAALVSALISAGITYLMAKGSR